MKTRKIELLEYKEKLESNKFRLKTLYHEPSWLSLVSNVFRADLNIIHTEFEDNSEALLPVIQKSFGPIKLLGSPLTGIHTEFLGPIFTEEVGEDRFKSALSSFNQTFPFFSLNNEIGMKEDAISFNPRSLEGMGYIYQPKNSLLIDLSMGEEELWKSFQGRARTAIRKSRKSDLKVRSIKPDLEFMNSYYRILEQTFKRRKTKPPHPLSFYISLLKLYESRHLLVVSCSNKESIESIGIFLIFNERLLFLSGASTQQGLKNGSSSLVQWEAMTQAIFKGVKEYDMGGLGISSIDKFKKSFGGRKISHHRWIKNNYLSIKARNIGKWLSEKGLFRMS